MVLDVGFVHQCRSAASAAASVRGAVIRLDDALRMREPLTLINVSADAAGVSPARAGARAHRSKEEGGTAQGQLQGVHPALARGIVGSSAEIKQTELQFLKLFKANLQVK